MLIDITFFLLLMLACYKGFTKGLVLALFSFIGLITGLAAALKLSAVVAVHLKDSLNISAKWMPFLSFILIFIVVLLLVRWGAKLLEKLMEAIALGWLNKIGGVLLFASLYTIILSIFLFYAGKINLVSTSTIQSSVCYAFIQPWGPGVISVFGKLIPAFKDIFEQLESFFSAFGQKIPG